MITESINHASKKLVQKVHTYGEAYIFVLEAEREVFKKLEIETPTDINKTMQGSYAKLAELLKPYHKFPSGFYRAILFSDLISGMEIFFGELLKAVLIEYPQKVGSSKVELKELIDGISLETLIERKADEEIYQLMYEKPEDYLKKLCKLLSLDEEKLLPFWPNYIEAKARRDLGVHNQWICNETYIRKTKKYDFPFKVNIGDNLCPLDRNYCTSVSVNLMHIAGNIQKMMIEKYDSKNCAS